MGQFKDLTGQKFKRLTVLYRAKNRIEKMVANLLLV